MLVIVSDLLMLGYTSYKPNGLHLKIAIVKQKCVTSEVVYMQS
jgi:hypothetical protein